VETVFSVLALHELLAPPTINVDDLDDEVTLDIVRGEPRKLPSETAAGPAVVLNNSFGFGGHNVVLAVRRA
jgi:3-oxoacyl-[acyl-carrier-protein] synthase II